jgi:hypothetical protein
MVFVGIIVVFVDAVMLGRKQKTRLNRPVVNGELRGQQCDAGCTNCITFVE